MPNIFKLCLRAFRTSSVSKQRLSLTVILAAVLVASGIWSVAISSSDGTHSFRDLYKMVERNAIGLDAQEYGGAIVLIDSSTEYPEGVSHFLVVTDPSGYRGLHRKYVFVLAPQDAPERFAPGQRVRIVGRVAQIGPEERGVRGKLYDHLVGLSRQIGATQSGALAYFEAKEITPER